MEKIKIPLPVGVRELRPNMSEDELRQLIQRRLEEASEANRYEREMEL